jgi:tetratricopeptide (TPR) repeat protein
MVRTKTKKAAIVSNSQAPPPPPTVASLIAKAQDLITQCDYDLALRFIRRALEQEPNNAVAREMLGVVEIERGELETAQQVSQSAHLDDLYSGRSRQLSQGLDPLGIFIFGSTVPDRPKSSTRFRVSVFSTDK